MRSEKPKLNQVNLIAGDIGGSVEFYRRLGVALQGPIVLQRGRPFQAGGQREFGMHLDVYGPAFAQAETKAGADALILTVESYWGSSSHAG